MEPVTKPLSVADREYLTTIAQQIYSNALELDREGKRELATAYLEVAELVMLAVNS